MKLCIFFLSFFFATNLLAQHEIEKVAKKLAAHKYSRVYKCFDETMKVTVSKHQIRELWEKIEATSGQFKSIEEIEITEVSGNKRQTAVLKFNQAAYKMILSESPKGEINGLYISQLGYNVPLYGRGIRIGKKFVNFLSHSYQISGELVVPIECNNCPVVILVHGSGPNDKDETIGPTKVFKDLALGLASKGIASYRYDKRFYLYPELMKEQFDLYDETINDAISAYHTLKSDTSLHFGKYVMLGHSLGAYSMPLIADSLKSLNGAILFSGNARKLEDLIEYQMHYLTGLDGVITEEEAKIINENEVKANLIRDNNFSSKTSSDSLLAYWPGTFWKGVKNYDPVSTLESNKTTEFFIMQGEKDYQITMEDFSIWTKNVGTQSNVKLQSFKNLTHLFAPTQSKKSGPNDYFIPNNVDEQVILEIADWIRLVVR